MDSLEKVNAKLEFIVVHELPLIALVRKWDIAVDLKVGGNIIDYARASSQNGSHIVLNQT